MAKALTYEELMEYAKAHYFKGGDATYETMDEQMFNEYTSQFGPITKSRALRMFELDYEIQKASRRW